MSNIIKPFIMNSDLCLTEDNISSVDAFRTAVFENIGNACPSYALIKTLFGKLVKVPQIGSIINYDFSPQENDINYINDNCTHLIFFLQGLLVKAWAEEHADTIKLFYLPSYSPELNPDEYLNNGVDS